VTWLPALRVVAISDRRLMVPAEVLAGDWSVVARAFGDAVARAVAGCAAGSVVVQIREKDLDGGPLLQLVRAAQPFAPIIVNDRVDVALAAGAAGVHLPERGLAIGEARALAPSLLVGVSRHGRPLDHASPGGADPAFPIDPASTIDPTSVAPDAPPAPGSPDLIQLGPIWPTPSKPTVPGLGEAALAWPHGAAALVAVGGIDTPTRAFAAAAAGADAVAVIRAAWSGASLAPFVAAVDAGRSRRSL
jgi:thiamine-phosphate pyrophosphorylase